jgi:SAM-dependent methyltransferase
MQNFICNICSIENACDTRLIHRELVPCVGCGSNARFRALMLGLSYGLTGTLKRLDELEVDPSLKGFGCSDADVYASRLHRMFNYTNTYFHTAPRLDITDASTFQDVVGAKFAICSDVIEHTLSPPQIALKNIYDSLAVGGFLVLSAPTYEMPATIERYPSLKEYTVLKIANKYVIVHVSAQGQIGLDTAPIFHGGPGSVLEMRILSHNQILFELRAAGFESIEVMGDAFALYGADWSPMVERADLPFALSGRIILARK